MGGRIMHPGIIRSFGLSIGASAAMWAGATLALALMVAVPRLTDAAPNERDGMDRFVFRAFDGFDGNFGLKWQPVRDDPSHYTLFKYPGSLTITTQQGTIHRDEVARNNVIAKNLFVIDNPLFGDTDFVITTCISRFKPTKNFQQAGLICYDDDDNYIKWVQLANSLNSLQETAARSTFEHYEAPVELKLLWLRMEKHGNVYRFLASTDGKNFQEYGETQWGDGSPMKIGILAKNGGYEGVEEIDACFEFFEIYSPITSPGVGGK
jgi:regulation of enolase protein 1 (concanavalin A-like superfamily)